MLSVFVPSDTSSSTRAPAVLVSVAVSSLPHPATTIASARQVATRSLWPRGDQALTVVDTPSETVRQIVRHVAAISTHAGHTIDSHHGLPADLRHRLTGFDEALEHHIRVALADGIERGEFRADLNIDTDSALLRHALGGVSSLVAATPDDAPQIVNDATRILLAALHRKERS